MKSPVVMLPSWPRSMHSDLASTYCGCSKDELPLPSYGHGRGRRWLIEDLDRHLDRLAGRVGGRSVEDAILAAME